MDFANNTRMKLRKRDKEAALVSRCPNLIWAQGIKKQTFNAGLMNEGRKARGGTHSPKERAQNTKDGSGGKYAAKGENEKQ